MPYDSEGNFTRNYNWTEDAQNDINIEASRMDEEFNNYANGMNEVFLRDGRASMTSNLKMGNFKITQMARGTVSTDAVNKGQLDENINSSNSALKDLLNKLWTVGDIKTSVKTENHDNWFLCNGQAINRVTYSVLFAMIGTRFGAGDGSSTFNLPDYRGKFLRGLGGNSASDIYKTQAEGLPNITAKTEDSSFCNIGKGSGAIKTEGGGSYVAGSGALPSNFSRFSFDAKSSNPIYGASEHVTPINQAVNFFIKVAEER